MNSFLSEIQVSGFKAGVMISPIEIKGKASIKGIGGVGLKPLQSSIPKWSRENIRDKTFEVGVTDEFLEKHGFESGAVLNLSTNIAIPEYDPPTLPEVSSEKMDKEVEDYIEEISIKDEFKGIASDSSEQSWVQSWLQSWIKYLIQYLMGYIFNETENKTETDEKNVEEPEPEPEENNNNNNNEPLTGGGHHEIIHDAKTHIVRLVSLGPFDDAKSKVYFLNWCSSGMGEASFENYSDVLFLSPFLAEYFGIIKKLNPYLNFHFKNEQHQRFELNTLDERVYSDLETCKILTTEGEHEKIAKAKQMTIHPINSSQHSGLGIHNIYHNHDQEIDYKKDFHKYFLTPRCVSVGDIICICLSNYQIPQITFHKQNTLEYHYKRLQNSRIFKVTKIEPFSNTSSIVDLNFTKIFIDPQEVNSPLPLSSLAYNYMSQNKIRIKDDWKEIIGLSLEAVFLRNPVINIKQGPLLPIWSELAQMIGPYINAKNYIRNPAILMRFDGLSGSGCKTVVCGAARALCINNLIINAANITRETISEIKEELDDLVSYASKMNPAILLIHHIEYLFMLAYSKKNGSDGFIDIAEEIIDMFREYMVQFSNKKVFLVVSCGDDKYLPREFRVLFTFEKHMKLPNVHERHMLVKHYLNDIKNIDFYTYIVNEIVNSTSGNTPRAIFGLCEDLLFKIENGELNDFELNERDFKRMVSKILRNHKKRISGKVKTADIPDVRWEDIGGLEEAKKAIRDIIEIPLKYRNLFNNNIPRKSGLLLHGPPGVGKTLLAKAIATECGTSFINIKGPELLNPYIGESERLTREVFEKAKNSRPCVLFFDELDALVPARKNHSSSGASNGVMTQILMQLDNKGDDIFVVGATNRKDLIDSALLRPGRIDTCIYVGVPNQKLPILQSLTRKFDLGPDVDLDAIARKCKKSYTGADLYAACSDAWRNAFKRTVKLPEFAEKIAEGEGGDIKIYVNQGDFETALENMI